MPAIAARPFEFVFPADRVALVVVDMQRDFLEAGGFGTMIGNDATLLSPAIEPTSLLLAAFRAYQMTVIHTREAYLPDLSDYPYADWAEKAGRPPIGTAGPLGRYLIDGEPGTAAIPALAPWPGEVCIRKPGKGAFHATDLDAILREQGIRHLVFAGVTTDTSVQTSLREAGDRGYYSLLAEDATASTFPSFRRATIDMVNAQCGLAGWVAPSSAIITALGRQG